MSIDHQNITDPYIHQPKGASTASANTVIIANGAGSTSWGKIGVNQVDNASIKNLNKYVVSFFIPDLTDAASVFGALPIAGTITNMYVTNSATPNADAVVRLKIGGTNVTNGNVTITSAAGAGTVFSNTPSANNVVTAGQAVEISCDGGALAASSANVTLIVSM